MVTPSTMIPLGTTAPAFTLNNVLNGEKVSLNDASGSKAYAIWFICNHCPYVIHLLKGLVEYAHEYQKMGVSVFAISSNDIHSYPQDAPAEMKKLASEYQFTFPYLFDEDQKVAQCYRAACTPDLYLFDQNLKLAYRGQFDDSRRGNKIPVSGNSFRQATDLILKGDPVPREQIASIGCNIKWIEGNEPDYFNPKPQAI